MRAFIACDLEPEAERRLEEVREWARRRGGPASLDASWTRPPFHVTLKFLGEVDEAWTSALKVDLDAVAMRHAAFAIEVGGFALFPPHGRPRVLVASVARGDGALVRIARDIDRTLAARGFPAETRPLRPHVTFARLRRGGSRALARTVGELALAKWDSPAVSRVGELVLYKSDLRPEGALHVPLHRAPLTGRGGS